MKEDTPSREDVDAFIRDEIETIPHLEALLLVWNGRPREWTVEEMAAELYVGPDMARSILEGLTRRKLLTAKRDTPERYCYESISAKRDMLIQTVDFIYRRELIRVSRMIHSNAAPAIRDFANAFRFTKNRERNGDGE